MKILSFFFIFILCCIFCMQAEAASRTRREDDTLEQFQKKLSESFDSVRKVAEEMAAKVDFKQLQQDFSAKFDEFAKSITDYTSPAAEKKPEEAP